jgi:ABC-type spermidine/putrescine transport system permease subunit I
MQIRTKRWSSPALLLTTLPLAVLLVTFFIVPLAMTGVLSFQGTEYYRLVWTWDLEIWREVFSRASYWSTMLRTLTMALIAVFLCVVISIPVAYALVHRLAAVQNHVKILIVFAFLTDAVLKSFGWVLFLDRSGVFNGMFALIGFGPVTTDILFEPAATMIGMVYNHLPYTIFTIYLSMSRIDRDLMQAAYDAGASKIRTFFEVTLPLSLPGILAGGVLVFVLSLGVFLEPKVLGGGKAPMAAELIRQTFETRVNWPLGAALTLVLIVIGALTVIAASALLLRLLPKTGEH